MGLPQRTGPISQSFSHYCSSDRTSPSSPLESLSSHSRRIRPCLQTPFPTGGTPIWGIPRFREHGLVQNSSSISDVWSLSGYHWPQVSRITRFMIAMGNTMVVTYSNKRGRERSYSGPRLVVGPPIPVATLSPQGQTHYGLPQCDCRPSVQARLKRPISME